MATGGKSADYNKLSEINACYQNSMTFVGNALEADENGNTNLAVEIYMKALKFLEDGVRVDITGPEYVGAEWSVAKRQQENMLKAQVKTKQRLYDIQESNADAHSHNNSPDVPTYSSALPEGHKSLSFAAEEMYDMSGASELLAIPSGVQIFFVSADQEVGTTPPSYPTFLKVHVLESTGQAFVQVSDWIYPLVSGETPALKMSNGAYVFPNRTSGGISPGSIGIVISSEIDPGLVETFENILQNLALFRSQETTEGEDVLNLSDSVHVTEESSISDKIVGGIQTGAEWLSYGLNKGAEITTDLVKKGSNKLKEGITPNDEPSTVNPTVKKGLYYTHEASRATVKVSRFLVDGLCAITSKVSQEIAPHVKDYSKKVLPDSVTSKDQKGESKMDGVIKVAGAGLAGFGTVWAELEKSGLAIARSVSSATVENVQLKYGQEAGTATSHAMGSVVNVGKTAFNLDNLGLKAIAKRAAKDTGKAVLKEYSAEAKEDNSKCSESNMLNDKPNKH
uniref:spartin-like n=1 Tax=Styela clava TaxID=7725 RepID=UPI00193A5498|nr:spartin-like [Styela clava]